MTIGILSATDREFQVLQNKSKDLKQQEFCGRQFYQAEIEGKKVVFSKCGVGKVSCAISVTIMKLQYNVEMVIFVGTAGSLSKELNIGDIVVESSSVQHDFDGRPFIGKCTVFSIGNKNIESELTEQVYDIINKMCQKEDLINEQVRKELKLSEQKVKVVKGVIASGDQFISSKEQKDQILADTPEAKCVEMEGAAVAQACKECKIKHSIVRIVSDQADDSAQVSFDKFCDKIAGDEVCKIVMKLIHEIKLSK